MEVGLADPDFRIGEGDVVFRGRGLETMMISSSSSAISVTDKFSGPCVGFESFRDVFFSLEFVIDRFDWSSGSRFSFSLVFRASRSILNNRKSSFEAEDEFMTVPPSFFAAPAKAKI